MKSVEDRLATVVPLLPAAAQPRFAAPLAEGKTTDTRLIEAVRALARAEGLICSTKEEVARVQARVQVATAPSAQPVLAVPTQSQTPAPEDEASTLAAHFAACKTPHAQTGF